MCVEECPSVNDDGSIKTVKFWDDTTNQDGGSVTWDHEVPESGEFHVETVTAGERIGYNSDLTLDRLCVPDSKVLNNAFKDYL